MSSGRYTRSRTPWKCAACRVGSRSPPCSCSAARPCWPFDGPGAAEPADLAAAGRRRAHGRRQRGRAPRRSRCAARASSRSARAPSCAAYVGPGTRVMELAGRTLVPGLRGRARALPRHRLRAPRRRPRRNAAASREVRGAGREGGQGPRARRVDPRTRLARGEVDDAGAGRRARLPDAPGALGRLARQPRDPRARRRPRGARQREGDGALRHHAADRRPPRAARSSATRAGRRPASSSTTPSASSRPQERSEAELRRAIELAMDECLAKGVTSLVDAGAARRRRSRSTRSWPRPASCARGST